MPYTIDMMYEVLNAPKKLDIDLLDKAVMFACEYLDLDIDVTIEFETLAKHQYGFCDYDEEDGGYVVNIAKRLGRFDMLTTFFHEMVHVQQYAQGRLVGGYKNRWLGEEYDCDYMSLPWEQEAFAVEEKMMKAFQGE